MRAWPVSKSSNVEQCKWPFQAHCLANMFSFARYNPCSEGMTIKTLFDPERINRALLNPWECAIFPSRAQELNHLFREKMKSLRALKYVQGDRDLARGPHELTQV